jgi:adenylate cyclase
MTDAALDEIRDLAERGEFLRAYDDATTLLDHRPGDIELEYVAVSALARSGATDQAEARFVELGLLHGHTRGATGSLAQDIDALYARIAKDRALGATGERRTELAQIAATRYEHAFARHGGAYPCVNAATMWLVAGDEQRAVERATRAMELAPDDDYWSVVTRAEAAVLRRDADLAAELVTEAADQSAGAHAARASTCRQLRLICSLVGVDRSLIEPLRNPPVVHYAGHRIAPEHATGRFPADEEARVAADVADRLERTHPAAGFGSLASGGDVLVAEALLARGAELHVLLPFAVEDFVKVSVADGGDGWVRRMRACLDRATSVTYTTDGPFIGDDVSFTLCSAVAMGDAMRHARQLEADARQLVVWDGDTSVAAAAAGTASDVRTWATTGRPTDVVDSGRRNAPSSWSASAHERPARLLRAVLFADIAGFSSLDDLQMPAFMQAVMGNLAKRIEDFGDGVLLRRTWGDGIHLAFDSVDTAASCAVALQRGMAAIDLRAGGLGSLRGLRVGAHVGPVYEETDPITGQLSYMGANVTRAARIEPGTPVGEVYVTHPFAAIAELEGQGRWWCQYVGQVPAAKDHGRLPMYLLRPSTDSRDA